MSVVVGTNISHPALLPPTPPRTPGTLSPASKPSLALPGSMPVGASISPQPRSPLVPTLPNPNAKTHKSKHKPAPASAIAPPVPCYSMLRAQHATAIRYVLAKLRWDQTHSGYIPGCDPWEKIAIMIAKLEEELAGVEAAQRTLDKWVNCHYPIAPLPSKVVPCGPPSYEQLRAEEEEDRKRELALDKQLFAQFPFLKPAIIGPRTRSQQKAHVEMRKVIFEGDFYMDDLEEMMPDENLKCLLAGEDPDPYGDRRKKQPQPPPGYKMRKLTYDEMRCDKENAKIAKQLEERGIELPALPQEKKKSPAQCGPMTKEEYLASLPKFGPKTKAEAMLPIQREQRQMILAWLKQPWPTYDDEAAGLMHKLGTLAFVRMEEKVKAKKGGGERRPSAAPGGTTKSKRAEGGDVGKEDGAKDKGQVKAGTEHKEPEAEAEGKKQGASPANGDAKVEHIDAVPIVEKGQLEVEVEGVDVKVKEVEVVEPPQGKEKVE